MAFASGLHPWEFHEYTLDDILLRLSGLREKRKGELRELYQQVQMQAYYTVLPYLKTRDRNKPISDIVPDIYEEKTATESLKQKAERLKKLYRRVGLLHGKSGN